MLYKILASDHPLLTFFSFGLRTNLSSRITSGKKCVIQTSLSVIQIGAPCINET